MKTILRSDISKMSLNGNYNNLEISTSNLLISLNIRNASVIIDYSEKSLIIKCNYDIEIIYKDEQRGIHLNNHTSEKQIKSDFQDIKRFIDESRTKKVYK